MTATDRKGHTVEWKCHTPNLLAEVLRNRGAEALCKPINIFGKLLAAVAERAAQINDPELNLLMLRLTLYEAGDPELHSSDEIEAAYSSQIAALKAQGASHD